MQTCPSVRFFHNIQTIILYLLREGESFLRICTKFHANNTGGAMRKQAAEHHISFLQTDKVVLTDCCNSTAVLTSEQQARMIFMLYQVTSLHIRLAPHIPIKNQQ